MGNGALLAKSAVRTSSVSRRFPPFNRSIYFFNDHKMSSNRTWLPCSHIHAEIKVSFQPSDGVTPKVLYVYGTEVGNTKIKILFNDSRIEVSGRTNYVDIQVVHSVMITSIIAFIGLLNIVCWTLAAYPQSITNFQRKSVVGLNFDYLAYNIVGFFCFSCFNIGLFFFPAIQDEYFDKYGGSVIPVLSNDVFVGLHALTMTTVCVLQCFIYERGDQKISLLCKILLGLVLLFALCSLIPALMLKITWLTYLQYFSYIKLGSATVKYVPQAYMNYRRKSTSGFSIVFVILDIIGAIFSLAQMFLLSYNNNQWDSIFGNVTKFGQGVLLLSFNILFTLQHYVFYKSTYEPILDTSIVDRRTVVTWQI